MLAVLAVAVLLGVWKGMAWQVASLCSVFVSAAVAIHSSPAVAPWFGQQEPWNRFVAMAVLYVVTAAAIWILFRLVSGIIDRVKLKEFDRQLGAIFGLAKGVLVLRGHHVLRGHALGARPASRARVALGRPDRPRHPLRQSDPAGRHPRVSGQVHRRVRREAARPAGRGAEDAGRAGRRAGRQAGSGAGAPPAAAAGQGRERRKNAEDAVANCSMSLESVGRDHSPQRIVRLAHRLRCPAQAASAIVRWRRPT